MDAFESNQEFANLPVVNPGDFVVLKSASGLGYFLKCHVESRETGFLLVVPIECLTLDGSSITNGNGAELIGKTLEVKPCAVKSVVR